MSPIKYKRLKIQFCFIFANVNPKAEFLRNKVIVPKYDALLVNLIHLGNNSLFIKYKMTIISNERLIFMLLSQN